MRRLFKKKQNLLIKTFNPLLIVILVWVMTLCTYAFPVSYDIPNNAHELFFIATISILCFSIAYLPMYLYTLAKCNRQSTYEIEHLFSIRYMRIFFVSAILTCFAIVTWTVFKDGLFPFMKIFGYEVKDYRTYGRFKAILFPIIFILFMVSSFEERRIIDWCIKLICLLIAWLYVSRSAMVYMVFQEVVFLVGSGKYRTIKSFKSAIIISVVFVIFVIGYVGMIRTGNDAFRKSMRIKSEYADTPTTLLWLTAYLSMPSVNLLSVIENCHQFTYGKMLLNSCLPAPFQAHEYHTVFYQYMPNQFNNVGTYLAYAFIDFSWCGILFVNMVYGALGGILFGRICKSPQSIISLYYSVYLTALCLIFFTHTLFLFHMILEFLLIAVFAAYIKPSRSLERKMQHENICLHGHL